MIYALYNKDEHVLYMKALPCLCISYCPIEVCDIYGCDIHWTQVISIAWTFIYCTRTSVYMQEIEINCVWLCVQYVLIIIYFCCLFQASTLANMSDCSIYNPSTSFLCNSRIWTMQNTTCHTEQYTGSACRLELLIWQECAVGRTDSGLIAINASGIQAELEQEVADVLEVVGTWGLVCHP